MSRKSETMEPRGLTLPHGLFQTRPTWESRCDSPGYRKAGDGRRHWVEERENTECLDDSRPQVGPARPCHIIRKNYRRAPEEELKVIGD